MARAKHPLVAAHRAHAAPHLVGQRLKAEPVIRRGQRARNGGARPVRGLRRQEDVDRLFEPALQQMFVAARTESAPPRACPLGPADGSGESRRGRTARARVRTDCRWRGGSGRAPRTREQILGRSAAAEGVERAIAHGRIARRDDSGQLAHRLLSRPRAISGRPAVRPICASTSSRSRPPSASASCAFSRP